MFIRTQLDFLLILVIVALHISNCSHINSRDSFFAIKSKISFFFSMLKFFHFVLFIDYKRFNIKGEKYMRLLALGFNFIFNIKGF